MRSYKAYLADQFTIHLYGHVAKFTSLVAWSLALLWLRFGYNSPVYPFGAPDLPSGSFWFFLQ